jgi:hypothetical protein
MSQPDYLVHDIDETLASMGVETIDPDGLWLRCKRCGELWSADLDAPHATPWPYCPNGCNADV